MEYKQESIMSEIMSILEEKVEKELEGLRPFINCIFITHT
jgi:hypothetical protein